MSPDRNHAKDHFDKWSLSYDSSRLQKWMFTPVHDRALNAYASFGVTPQRVLDIGCGTGRLLESAAQRWSAAGLVGIDLSEGMIAQANAKHAGDGRFTFKVGDSASIPLESAHVDAAFSTMSFHHWANQAQGIREVARVLRPGGVFVLADMHVPFIFRRIASRFDHATFRGTRTIRGFFEQAGLSFTNRGRSWNVTGNFLFVGRKG